MLSFRIISGSCKGRRIQAPKKLPVRPTTDRAKEALFNILLNQLDFDGARLLDLYAGTGNISYEFTSRGGASSTAIDSNRYCVQFIRETSEKLALPVTVVQTDVLRFLENKGTAYDWVFIDPPYDLSEADYQKNIDLVFSQGWVAEGLLVVEHPPRMKWESHPQWDSTRTYGSSCFSFFKYK